MFERFSAQARQVVVLAQEESRRLSHNYIGTEHLLLGLLAQPEGVAKQALDASGMTLDGARGSVEAAVGKGKRKPLGHIPFTPRAKKVLELSLREAVHLRADHIGTEHLLLGLIREGDGLGARVLTESAGDLLAVRLKVLDLVPPAGPSESRRRLFWQRSRNSAEVEAAAAIQIRTTGATDATLDEAQRLAGEAAVGSHHLLLATLNDPQSAAAKALGTLGVDLEQARTALRSVDLVGTTDELPEEAGRRQLAVHLRGAVLTLETTDEALVSLARSALESLQVIAMLEAPGVTDDGTNDEIRGGDPRTRGFADLWQAWHLSLQATVDSLQATKDAASASAHEPG
ncbi:MAG TPA: Clp protease N-terminal domain-containing protein [Acidothermaceae bacterium]